MLCSDDVIAKLSCESAWSDYCKTHKDTRCKNCNKTGFDRLAGKFRYFSKITNGHHQTNKNKTREDRKSLTNQTNISLNNKKDVQRVAERFFKTGRFPYQGIKHRNLMGK